jgi:hypothetical protein
MLSKVMKNGLHRSTLRVA